MNDANGKTLNTNGLLRFLAMSIALGSASFALYYIASIRREVTAAEATLRELEESLTVLESKYESQRKLRKELQQMILERESYTRYIIEFMQLCASVEDLPQVDTASVISGGKARGADDPVCARFYTPPGDFLLEVAVRERVQDGELGPIELFSFPLVGSAGYELLIGRHAPQERGKSPIELKLSSNLPIVEPQVRSLPVAIGRVLSSTYSMEQESNQTWLIGAQARPMSDHGFENSGGVAVANFSWGDAEETEICFQVTIKRGDQQAW